MKAKNGWTGFHIAAAKGLKEVARVLLELKASVAVKDLHGCTPLHLSASHGNYEVAKMILSVSDHSNVHTLTKVHTPTLHRLFLCACLRVSIGLSKV